MFANARELFDFIFNHLVVNINVYNRDYIYEEVLSDLQVLYEYMKSIDLDSICSYKKEENRCTAYLYTHYYFTKNDFEHDLWNKQKQMYFNNIVNNIMLVIIKLSVLVSPRAPNNEGRWCHFQKTLSSYLVWSFHRGNILKCAYDTDNIKIMCSRPGISLYVPTAKNYFESDLWFCGCNDCEELKKSFVSFN